MERYSGWWRGAIVGLVTVAIAGIASPASADPTTGKSGVDTEAVDRFVREFADAADYPGVAVAITKGDQVVYSTGYGEGSSGAEVTATTPMPIASVSKSFTALAVMQLVEAGEVDLDAPLHDYVADFSIDDPRGAEITVRQLLNHTSGITDETLAEKRLSQPRTLAEAVVRAHDATLAADPGTQHHYTNTNYHLAARLVEVVAEVPFTDYMRTKVFEPAGMSATTTINLTPDQLPEAVDAGYIYAYGADIPLAEPERFVAGSDGVISTAEDMAKWLVVQGNDGRTADGTSLLSPEGIQAMHESTDPRWTYGLGWDTEKNGRVRHSGIWFTYTAGQLLLPSGYGIAVMTSNGVGLSNEGTRPLEDGVATVLEGGTPDTSHPRLVYDLVLAAFTLISLGLGIRNLRRTDKWASRLATRPVWRPVLRLAPRLIPLAILLSLPELSALIAAGRDVNYVQIGYYSIALVAWSLTATTMNLAVLATRIRALLKHRSPNTTDTPQGTPVEAHV